MIRRPAVAPSHTITAEPPQHTRRVMSSGGVVEVQTGVHAVQHTIVSAPEAPEGGAALDYEEYIVDD